MAFELILTSGKCPPAFQTFCSGRHLDKCCPLYQFCQMCGRYTLTSSVDELRALFAFEGAVPPLSHNYNIAPTQGVPIIRMERDMRHFACVRWGLVPSWSKEVGPRPMFNARAETVSVKPSFRNAFRRRRCLVPANGYFEWQPRGQAPKQPYYITVENNGLFAMAGIWEQWMNAEGSELDSLAIITAPVNKALSYIHDRMPVMISEDAFDLWLDTDERTTSAALSLLKTPADSLLHAIPISTRVNRTSHNDPSVIEPLTRKGDQDLLF